MRIFGKMKMRLLPLVLFALSACGDWPEMSTAASEGPWPDLVPLAGLDVTSGAATSDEDVAALIAEGEALSARAERLRGRGAGTGRAGALSARAAILRGEADTPEAREAMRARLATLPGA